TSLPFSMAMATGFIYFFYQRARFEELRREATEAQLLLLQSQLEPHMLFNTLANLRALITTDPERAVQLLDHLNEFLRATLGASRVGTHAVGREIELLRDYLEIMAVRMGPRLRYRIDVDEGVSKLPIPALLLQPLVENGIRHGLEPKPEGGELCIAALRNGNDLIFEVRDTGIGVPPASASSNGFGLTHVRERLQSRYGTRANFSLLPRDGSGTIARVVLPIVE
ncbi:MAG TPA: histidine kinase, partial [Rhodocyclaceae bacterium]|nr:histidine kinase [Rhodocyclaceae bacterium]